MADDLCTALAVAALVGAMTALSTSCHRDVSRDGDAEYWIDRLGAEHIRISGNEWGLASRHPEVPAAALRRIGDSVVPVAIEVLRKNESYQKRMGAVQALALFGSAATPAIPELIEQIHNSDDKDQKGQIIRDAAVATILRTGTAGVDDARSRLAAALRRPGGSDEYRKRVGAAYALASLETGNGDAAKTLTHGLIYEGPDAELVRRDALYALQALAGSPGLKQSKLSTLDEPTATALAVALMKIVQTGARGREFSDKNVALNVLQGIGPRARLVIPALRAMLANQSEAPLHPWVRGALSTIDQPAGSAPR